MGLQPKQYTKCKRGQLKTSSQKQKKGKETEQKGNSKPILPQAGAMEQAREKDKRSKEGNGGRGKQGPVVYSGMNRKEGCNSSCGDDSRRGMKNLVQEQQRLTDVEGKTPLVNISEENRESLNPSEEAMKSSSDLIVYGAMEDEMSLGLHLLKATKPSKSVIPINAVISLTPKSVGADLKLTQRYKEGMHPVTKGVLRADDESTPDLKKVLCIKGHLRAQTPRTVHPSSLNEALVDIFLDGPVQHLFGGQEMSESIQGILERGETINLDTN
ncbi:hypothetical protein KI387_018603 [Taxus chinensis]|uniref:Uncharacterized protein n=1 Tax=Taxus chinensis TaxID=29808 RepID=A0AA38L9G8_TAXCH|nr:hypothetical protein KI387_018603 [Taxus chinensis]